MARASREISLVSPLFTLKESNPNCAATPPSTGLLESWV